MSDDPIAIALIRNSLLRDIPDHHSVVAKNIQAGNTESSRGHQRDDSQEG
jgi:hypothetical protein